MKAPQAKHLSKVALVPVLGALALGGGFAARAHAAPDPGAPLQAQPAGPAGDVSALVTSVQPAVVNITVEHLAKASPDVGANGASPFDFFFRQFGQPGRGIPFPRGGKQIGAGSGFIFDDKGHVLTNAHVVDGADTVKVKLSDERELRAEVKGKDEKLDVAVLEIAGAKNLPHVTLGSSASLKVGEPVVAIGNPFGLGGTVTSGIVSAKSRTIGAGPYDDFIQTDASINPGNSGGPLFDLRGQVVGMNTAINPNGQGIGFAIPSDAIREILPQLIDHGHVRRAKLGAHVQPLDEGLAKALGIGAARGALVGEVERGSPGEAAGLRDGDVIVAVDGAPVLHAHDLPRMIASHAPGSRATLEVRRGAGTVKLPVTLGELDDEKQAKQEHDPAPAKGSLGIELGDAKEGGATVQRVAPNGPAADSLAPGDVILEVDHQPVKNAAEAVSKIRSAPTDKPLLLKVRREGATRWVAVERAPSR